MKFTTEQLRGALPSVMSLSPEDLVRVVRPDVSNARALAALIVLMDKAERPEILNYHEYLRSDSWRRVRERKLREAGRVCSLCPSVSNLHVHHRTYERLGKERLDDLVVLCRRCHSRHHSVLA